MPLAGIGVRIPDTNKVIIPVSISILNPAGAECGFVSDLSYDPTRTVERIRVLRASAAGRIVEQVPAPEDYVIRCTGFALYDYTLLGQLLEGISGASKVFHCLNSQYIPFTIKLKEEHPVTGSVITTKFGDCWMTAYSHPTSYRNLYISETCSIQPSWVLTEESPEGGEDTSWPVEQAQ